ncbi:hypothetical protein RFI_22966 [Reticulomyxa filosa]|uniref:Uncharacterized protein n=1 Tax=Reticulomyxa filosa TaxID=46433 RepID=X6MK87_RETFI|nr:hypothetical protein RFI_22966 [Reticulomyxa filosa]|eukprot:ETO14398.1 hypothetical protein RFI_22966 [Reticulomyxa filosa]
MSSPAGKRAIEKATVKAPYWGKWGALNTKYAEKFMDMAWNRGYGQMVLPSRYSTYDEAPTLLTFLAARWRYDWLKHIAMRVDAQRTPLRVLRNQIWIYRAEYWARRWYSRKTVVRAAKCEWAYIKERLRQPFTWTGHDLAHGSLWLLNFVSFWAIGEAFGRASLFGYPIVTPEWTPARPKFTPGFFHVYDALEPYPFENSSAIQKQFGRSGYWANSSEVYWSPHRIVMSYVNGG